MAVGYRVKSSRGVQFRKWATTTLKEYLVKGFVMNDERLKDTKGWDYFDQLLKRVRDISACEKRFCQKVRDLFSVTSVDYDKNSESAKVFFQTIQNELLFAEAGLVFGGQVTVDTVEVLKSQDPTSWRIALNNISKSYFLKVTQSKFPRQKEV